MVRFPSTACGRGKDAEGGEGEGLSWSRPSGPHPGLLRKPVPLPQAVEGKEKAAGTEVPAARRTVTVKPPSGRKAQLR